MNEGLAEIERAIVQVDFELLNKSLTGKTPEFCSEALRWAVRKEWKISSLVDDSIIPVGIKHYPETSSTKIIQIFLDHGADVNYYGDGPCWNTFHYACNGLSARIVKIMLNHGADLNCKTTCRNSLLPIQLVFKSKDADKMNFFLDLGTTVEEINCLHLLHGAAESSVEIVERLIKLGVDLNCMDDMEGSFMRWIPRTPLEAAISMGNIDIVKHLFKNGANLNSCYISPLSKAITSRNYDENCLEIMKILLQFGANIDGRRPAGDREFRSPICAAALMGRVKILEFLLDKGVEQHDRALFDAISQQHVNVVKILLDRGYDPNCVGTSGDDAYGWQKALFWAAFANNERIAKLLLDYGAQVDGVVEEREETILHLVVANSLIKPYFVQLLLDHGADINKERHEQTALAIAVRMNANIGVSKCLVRHVMLIKAQDLYVSEKNLKACEGHHGELELYQRECEGEIDVLKTSKFCDSNLSYLDIFTIKDVKKLASLANNQNILRVLKSKNFKNKFPIYGQMTVDRFDKGILRNKDFELFKRFINYLAFRDHDELPELPFTVASQIFDCMSDKDFAGLRNL